MYLGMSCHCLPGVGLHVHVLVTFIVVVVLLESSYFLSSWVPYLAMLCCLWVSCTLGYVYKVNIHFVFNEQLGFAEVYLNNVNVEDKIRTIEVSQYVSQVATISEVRAQLVEQQQEMGKKTVYGNNGIKMVSLNLMLNSLMG